MNESKLWTRNGDVIPTAGWLQVTFQMRHFITGESIEVCWVYEVDRRLQASLYRQAKKLRHVDVLILVWLTYQPGLS